MKISALASFACFAALAIGAMAHSDQSQTTSTAQSASTPAPTTAKTAAPTPAPTTGKSATTPAPTMTKTVTTPAPTTAKQAATTLPAKLNCFNISVEGDATYCISGPICSGSGKAPAGANCPKKGDVAVQSCIKTLKSYAEGGKCVAPVDAECKVIRIGAWGCVWKGAEPIGAPSGKSPITPAPTTGKAAGTPAPAIAKSASTPTPTTANTAATPVPTTGKTVATPAPTTGKMSSTPAPMITKPTQTGSQPREAVQHASHGNAKEGKGVTCFQF